MVLPTPGVSTSWGADLNAHINDLDARKVEEGSLVVNVKDHGAIGDGVANDTTALQAALTAAGNAVALGVKTVLIPAGTFNINAALTVPAGVTVMGSGTIKQTASGATSLSLSGADTTIRGIKLTGLGTDYVSGGSPTAVGVSITAGSSNVLIDGLRIASHAGAGVKVLDSTDVTIRGCTIIGTTPPAGDGTQHGIWLDTNAARITITDNDISATAQGVITGTTVTEVQIVNNQIHDISGQHGIYLQNGSRVVVVGNTIRSCNYNGMKFQLSAISTADSTGLVICSNTVRTTGDQGIILTSTDAARTYKFRGVTLSGNVVRFPSGAGLYIDAARFVVAASNVIDNPGQHGVFVTNATDVAIDNNIIENANRVGVYLTTGYARVQLRNNVIINPAAANVASTQYGIYALSGDNLTMVGNRITADHGLMVYGIFFGSGDQASSDWRHNYVAGANAYGARLIATTPVREWWGNNFNGTTGAVLNPPTTGRGQRAREEFAGAAPTAGTYAVGDRVWNTAPAAGGTMGWVCTTAGTPGTWKTFGAISA